MKRGVVRTFVTVTFLVIALLPAHKPLYGESKNFSQPITPYTPAQECEKNKLITTYKHIFSDRVMHPSKKYYTFNPHSVKQFLPELTGNHFPYLNRKSAFKIQEWIPDSPIHYFIAELKVRRDIDYKIRKLGR